MFAMNHYDNPQADGEDEFFDDLKRFKYLKRLLKKYHDKDDLKERLILNHIIVLTNVFGVEASSTLLLFKVDQEHWASLKTFMLYLNMITWDEPALINVQIDKKIWKTLQNI